MKKFIVLAVALVSCVGFAKAASLRIELSADNDIYAVYLEGITAADQVTALSFSALPDTGVFENYSESGYGPSPDFNLLVAGDPASFTNAKLSLNAGPPFFWRRLGPCRWLILSTCAFK